MRSALLTLTVLLARVEPGVAQAPNEFGVRFTPQNFEPLDFRGFSFNAPPLSPQQASPIRFNPIAFPTRSSAALRREFTTRGLPRTRPNEIQLDPPPADRGGTRTTDRDRPFERGRSVLANTDRVRVAASPSPARTGVATSLASSSRIARGVSPSRLAVLQDDPIASRRTVLAATPTVARRLAIVRPATRTVQAANPTRTAALERTIR